jgi:pimeloyl-ACP methyl ester carboxylesterase
MFEGKLLRPPVALRFLPVLLVAALLPGCGILRKPDMTHTTGIAKLSRPLRPLILVHGFIGSKLRDAVTHKVVWGTMANVLTGGDNDRLALPMDDSERGSDGDNLEAYEIYESLWGRDFYREILRSLRAAGGYQIGDIDHPKPGDNAFVFVYDWRRDNVDSARRLAEAIQRLKTALGRPDEKFDLLTHSQGGLIARYYVMYGGRDVLEDAGDFAPSFAGAASVNKVIMLGTPNRGCLESLKILHLGVKKVFRPMRPEVVFTMPSVFQMLPPRGSVVFADQDGRPIDLDLYDADTWVTEGWSAFSAESQRRIRGKAGAEGAARLERYNQRARRFLEAQLRRADLFHRALDAPAAADPEVAYYAFGSDCINTLKTVIVAGINGRRELVFDSARLRGEPSAGLADRVLYGPGDGTVLMQSLLAIPDGDREASRPPEPGRVSFRSAFFVCGSHGVLPNDPIFQNNLLYLLLWRGGKPPAASLASVTAGR